MHRSSLPTLRTFIQHLEALAKEHGDDAPVVKAMWKPGDVGISEPLRAIGPATSLSVIETNKREGKVFLVDMGRAPESVFRAAAAGMETMYEAFEVAVRIL